jgi:hypothetical protein
MPLWQHAVVGRPSAPCWHIIQSILAVLNGQLKLRFFQVRQCRDSHLAECALSNSKHHSALIHRTSHVHPRTSIFIVADLARARPPCASSLVLPISCPSHVRWCSLVRFSCYFLLSDISPSSYSCHRAARGTGNPYYMYAYLYLAYSACNFRPGRLATLAVLHIFWTSCRCSGSLFHPSYSLCVVDSLALRIYFPLTLACRAAIS